MQKAIQASFGALLGPEACNLFISRRVFGRVRRPKNDKDIVLAHDDSREVFAVVVWRHVACAAVRAVVVTHAGPFIGPCFAAARAGVVVCEPSHRMASRHNADENQRNRRYATALADKIVELALIVPYAR